MKVLVPVKRAVDYNVKVQVNPDRTGVDLDNVKMSVNPFCEIAIEEAVRLKEAGLVEEAVAVSVGIGRAQEQLRMALALGMDRAILVEVEGEVWPLAVAKALKAVYDQEKPDLVLFGKQSIDGDNAQTGQMFAALCGLPQATFAYRLTVADGRVTVVREIDGGLQTLALTLPAVVTADLRLNEPRYASLPNIMKAKRKPLVTMTPADLGVELPPTLQVLRVEPPASREAGIIVEDVDELVDKLRNEAKVI